MKLSIPVVIAAGLAACQPAEAPKIDTPVAAAIAPENTAPVTPAAPEAELFAVSDGQKTFPEPFRGRWDATVAACAETSDMKLTIDETGMTFWESSATLTSLVSAGSNAIKIEARGFAEGEEWSPTFVMRLADGGSSLIIDTAKRVRCPK